MLTVFIDRLPVKIDPHASPQDVLDAATTQLGTWLRNSTLYAETGEKINGRWKPHDWHFNRRLLARDQ